MARPNKPEPTIEQVTEIYVAVFPVPVDENRRVEVILAGYQRNPEIPNTSIVRATVETHAAAVPELVALCDEIVLDQSEIVSYRLLRFDRDGVHVLRPDDFRSLDQKYSNGRWGFC
jgi:hypothetical protein